MCSSDLSTLPPFGPDHAELRGSGELGDGCSVCPKLKGDMELIYRKTTAPPFFYASIDMNVSMSFLGF